MLFFSISPFGNHVKKSGSNFTQRFRFSSKSNLNVYLCPTQCTDRSLNASFRESLSKDFTITTGNVFL